MPDSRVSPDSRAATRWLSPAFLLGFAAVALARLLTLPRTLWEGDEVLFVKGVELFDPVHHQPHPPGYPLVIGLGKLLNLLLHDPFTSLVTVSVIASLVGYAALVDAFGRIVAPAGEAAARRVAVAGAVLFLVSPAMLVYGPLALSDPPALMFLALALAAAARLAEDGADRPLRWAIALGTFASAAVGCRPQLAVAVLPMLAAALWQAPRPRRIASAGAALAAFTAVSLLWFVPLLLATGGPAGLAALLGKQAGLVAQYDTTAVRTGGGAAWVATRFIAHPWGTRWTSLPVLSLAGLGIAVLAASCRRALPLAVLCGVDLAFCLRVMNPDDAVRYALPSLLGVALAAAVGAHVIARRARVPVAVWPAVGLLVAGFVVYTEPLLAARATSASPPLQAARWIERSLPPDAVLVVEAELAPHASYLLRKYARIPADPGLQKEAAHRLTRPDFLLGDGESAWPGTVRFVWPESDAYGKLTRGHLRVVSVSPIPPDRWVAPVRGVYAFEPSIREPLWRWLGPDAAVRLALRSDPPRLVAVTLGLPGHAPVASVRVTISVNGAPLAVVKVPRAGRQMIVLPLPAAAAGTTATTAETESAEITFHSDASFVPAAAGVGPDTRRLAVQLFGLERTASESYHEEKSGTYTFSVAGDPDVQRRGEHRSRHLLRRLGPGALRR